MSVFRKTDLDAGRAARADVIVVAHRKLGATSREDQEVLLHGPADSDTSRAVKAFLDFLIERRKVRFIELMAALERVKP